jgi:hypothetical protein
MENFQSWSELFGLIEEDVIYQKRILAAVSGAILPLVALGFIKSLIDYIKPEKESKEEIDDSNSTIAEYLSPDNEYIEREDSSPIDSVDETEEEIESPIEEEIESPIEEKKEKPIENRGIQIEENNLLPVNSNKRIDDSGKVNINPLLL